MGKVPSAAAENPMARAAAAVARSGSDSPGKGRRSEPPVRARKTVSDGYQLALFKAADVRHVGWLSRAEACRFLARSDVTAYEVLKVCVPQPLGAARRGGAGRLAPRVHGRTLTRWGLRHRCGSSRRRLHPAATRTLSRRAVVPCVRDPAVADGMGCAGGAANRGIHAAGVCARARVCVAPVAQLTFSSLARAARERAAGAVGRGSHHDAPAAPPRPLRRRPAAAAVAPGVATGRVADSAGRDAAAGAGCGGGLARCAVHPVREPASCAGSCARSARQQ